MKKYTNIITSKSGDALAGINVKVLNQDGTTATIYSDNGTTQIPGGVLTTDGGGIFSFYATNGHYNLQVSGQGINTYTLQDELLYDPRDDESSLAGKATISDLASTAIGKGMDLIGDGIRASSLASSAAGKGVDLIGDGIRASILADTANGHGADLIANAAKKVASIAALRALRVPQGSDAQTVIVDGYASANDGGGGEFIWSATATNADDGGTVIAPNSGAGRWLRLFSGVINVKWFGAKGDYTGTTGTDDTAAIQAAINVAQNSSNPATYGSNSPALGSCRVFFPSGDYKVTAALTASRKVAFEGEGQSEFSSGSRIVQFTANTDLFQIDPIAQGCSVSFEKLTLKSNANGSGFLVNILNTNGTCNSQRYIDCVFGTPQSAAIRIKAGDDIKISRCLFDVSATGCISLGTSTAADVVSNVIVSECTFFSIAQRCFLPFNVDGLLIANNVVYPSNGGANTQWLIDGYNSLPYQLKNIIVKGNKLSGISCLVQATAVAGLAINGNRGNLLGAGAGSTLSGIQLNGSCSEVNISGNTLSGNFDTKNFYNDSAATVTASYIGGNTLNATGGTGQAVLVAATTGAIQENACSGFTAHSVGEQWFTSGNAISSIGVLSSLQSNTYNVTVTGAKQGDKVTLTPASTSWPVPAGIVVTAYVSALNTVTIQYTNVTGSAIGVPAHDFGILVTR